MLVSLRSGGTILRCLFTLSLLFLSPILVSGLSPNPCEPDPCSEPNTECVVVMYEDYECPCVDGYEEGARNKCKPETVGMSGDPHIKTWGGKWFDYMGQCDLVLLHVPNFNGQGDELTIQARTTIRYDYSFIESAAVQIGSDLVEIASFGDYAVNGVDTPYLGGHAGRISHYSLVHNQVDRKKHTFDIILGPKENITLTTFKNLVAVSINAGQESAKYFNRSVGVMGSFDGKLLARDGATVMEDMNAFGQEWQVTEEEPSLFRESRAPQHPSKCILPAAKASKQRRLGATIARQAAVSACAHLSGDNFENCVFDVMAIGDIDIAGAL